MFLPVVSIIARQWHPLNVHLIPHHRQLRVSNNIIQRFLHKYTPRRALMYVPGNDQRKLQKALALTDVDCIALDCEDGVAISQKSAARQSIRSFLEKLPTPPQDCRQTEWAVRINATTSGLCEEDLRTIFGDRPLRSPKTVLLPKCESAADITCVIVAN